MKPRDKLYQIAYRQQGYFTARQAALAGYADSAPTYHVSAGNWIREDRGIYRLCSFPEVYRPDLMIYWLWSFNRETVPQGIYSHRTALDLHDLCDVMPRKVHMTVPHSFRRSVLPRPLALHYRNVEQKDITYHDGIPLTSVYRTLVDMISEKTVSPEQLVMAIETALERRTLTQECLAKMRSEFHPDFEFIDFLFENLSHDATKVQEA